MTNIYTNENFPSQVVLALRGLQHDVLTTAEAGKAGQAIPDEAVLAFAVNQARVLITMNRKHFIRLHRLQPDHSGIIVCTFDPDYAGLALRIHTTLVSVTDLKGQLLRVNRPA
ncbi:MAG: DUF5615 family PIN-like protein [Roseiflexaceae bacterium]|nr:DUF5615 family PIN-like protein [Roseiflexaceae bacterium]